MRKFRQTSEILGLMARKEAIRNIGVIAHIDHGKTTVTDALMVEAGLLPPKMVGRRALDYLEEEQKRGITIKTANISFLCEAHNRPYIINLVDTPGHVDFTGRVARALRAIDGAVVVVDAVEEIMAQTETVLRQALAERVKPVLFINKVDRLIREMKLSENEIQNKFTRIIEGVNSLIEVYGENEFKDAWKVNPKGESVAFGSALHNWGLTAKIADEKGIKFNDIIKAYKKGEHEEFSRLTPLHNAIFNVVIKNIPNPSEAQKYRIPKIWKGKLDSEMGQAMLNCDSNGPLVMCITNVQPDATAGLVSTGRLFSGSVKAGDPVYLVNAGKECVVKQVSMYMGAFREIVDEISAGNIAALTGLELARAGETVVNARSRAVAVPFEHVSYFSEPVMTMVVEPKNPRDLPFLVEAMNRLCIEDPNLNVAVDRETGHYLLSGIGELHLEIAIKSLAQYSGGIELVVSSPIVAYRETILEQGVVVTAKTSNKQNVFWVQVEPLEKEVVKLIDKGEIAEETALEQISEILHLKVGYSKAEAEKVCAFNKHGNILVNFAGKIAEIEDSVVLGFQWACNHGSLCEEPLRNVKVKLVDAQLHKDPEMREPAQIMRAISRGILGSALTAKPTLLEPIYKIEVSVPTQWLGTCTNILTRRRGKIRSVENRGALTMVNGYIPVSETFGLASEMRSATSGTAFWQCVFSHWDKAPENIAIEVIRQIRARRGLPPKIPKPEEFID
ncbi:MAG: elongation factor EF-2 [Candidatus Bathyarchaeia archaeon]